MKIRVYINDNNEWFDNFDDAIYYLENAKNNYEDEDESEETENTNPERYSFKENYNGQKVSLSLKDSTYKRRLKNFLSNGYKITYEGKTGVTLEKDMKND